MLGNPIIFFQFINNTHTMKFISHNVIRNEKLEYVYIVQFAEYIIH